MHDLSSRVAVITGAGGGIGKEIARLFIRQGARVALVDISAETLSQTEKELGPQTKGFVADLRDPSVPPSLLEDIKTTLGAPSVLINNAGITKDNLALRIKDEDWNAVIEINLNAVFRLSRAFLPTLAKQPHGRIINMASIIGCTGNVGQANYAASKGGLIALTKSLALEYASKGLTVNAIAPGYIRTAMTDALAPQVREAILAKVPLKRIGEAEDVAQAALFLASDEAKYITGTTIHVNGGMFMA